MKPLKVLLPELHPAQLKILERAMLSRVIGEDAVLTDIGEISSLEIVKLARERTKFGQNQLKAEQRHNLKVLIYGKEK